MIARRRLAALVGVGLALGASSQVHAHATLHVENGDAAGEGFNDPTPASPIDGNMGKTVGEQRMLAVQHAADLWGEVLDSDVTIEIEATFDELGCSSGGAVLGQASPAGIDTGISRDGADPSLIYPRALAERLAGEDMYPGEPDIVAFFNSSVGKSDCLGGLAWYYGFETSGDELHGDLVNIALHELGHGLGVTDFADLSSGALIGGMADAYTTHVLDISTGKRWDQMTDSERLSSLVNVRKVVWQGPHVLAAAAGFLQHGAPHLRTMPAVSGLTGIVSDASFGTRPLAMSLSAALMLGNPLDGSTVTPNVAGKIVLLRPTYQYSVVAAMLAQAGALGVLMAVPSDRETPPLPLEEVAPAAVSIPVLSITDADATRLQTALGSGSLTAQLSADPAQLIGADGMGQVMLNATQPASVSSSISHWDTSARPNLLMEPISTPGQPNDVDLTGPMLIDLGWTPFCGNGRLDQEETCDDGANNDDKTPDACRSDCKVAHCGDGVKDKGESCDDGAKNSDSLADACRTDCSTAHCGDGVKDKAEACDRGKRNSDSAPDECRTDCKVARCGDGVKDRDEACDRGAQNSDSTADACRADCSMPRCGDGVQDQAEACDDGNRNDDTTADACRSDCKLAGCGDGVKDQGEACDDGTGNSDAVANACRTDCTRAHCGDGVKDRGETCDDGSGQCKTCKKGGAGSANVDGGTGGNEGNAKSCSCSVPGGRRGERTSRWLVTLLIVAGISVRSRRRSGRRC